METNKKLDANQKMFLKKSRRHKGFGAFSDPGVGKTIPALLKGLNKGATRILISCPVSAFDEWRDAIRNDFDNSYKVYEDIDEVLSARMLRKPAICLLNHDMVKHDKYWQKLRALGFDHFILDEGDFLVSHSTAVSRRHCLIAVKIDSVVVMTGTAWKNKDKDIFGLMKFINPSVLGDVYEDFTNEWCINAGWMGKDKEVRPERVEELADLTAPYYYRIALDEIENAPPKAYPNKIIRVPLNKKTRRIYDNMETNLITEYKKGTMTAKTELVGRLRCAEIAGGVATLDRQLKGSAKVEDLLTPVTIERSLPVKHRIGSEKRRAMSRWLRKWKAGRGVGRKVLVFYRFKMDGKAVSSVLQRHYPDRWALIDGSTPQEERTRLRKDFKAGNLDALALQERAGSRALNLQEAYTTLFYSFGHSHVNHSQGRRRTRRRGQTHRCLYVYFIVENTVEEDIYDDLKRKKARAHYVYDKLRIMRQNRK